MRSASCDVETNEVVVGGIAFGVRASLTPGNIASGGKKNEADEYRKCSDRYEDIQGAFPSNSSRVHCKN
jgi:hypothetical protein